MNIEASILAWEVTMQGLEEWREAHSSKLDAIHITGM